MPTEVFRAGQTEKVSAFCKDGPEQRLQADGALQRLAVEDCSQFVRVGVVVAGCLAAVGEPVSDEGPALLVGDAGGEAINVRNAHVLQLLRWRCVGGVQYGYQRPAGTGPLSALSLLILTI